LIRFLDGTLRRSKSSSGRKQIGHGGAAEVVGGSTSMDYRAHRLHHFRTVHPLSRCSKLWHARLSVMAAKKRAGLMHMCLAAAQTYCAQYSTVCQRVDNTAPLRSYDYALGNDPSLEIASSAGQLVSDDLEPLRQIRHSHSQLHLREMAARSLRVEMRAIPQPVVDGWLNERPRLW
jgi:hypothetical protein